MKNRATLSLAVASIVLFITGSAQGPLSASSVGSAWSSPDSTPVGLATPNISNDSIASSSPAVAMSGNKATAVWSGDTFTLGQTVIQVAYSSDSGATWVTPTSTPQGANTPNLSGIGAADSAASVAMSGNNAVAVWVFPLGGFDVVQTAQSSDGGVTWSNPTTTPTVSTPNLSNLAADAQAPQISISGQNVVATWLLDIGGFDVLQSAYSSDAGVTWSYPTTTPGSSPSLSDSAQSALAPAVAVSGTTVVASWYVAATGLVSVARSSDGGANWTNPTSVPTGAVAPALSVAGQDAALGRVSVSGSQAVVVWKRSNGTNYVIQTAFSTDSGVTWASPASTPIGTGTPDLSDGSQDANDVSVSMDGDNVVAVWTRSNGVGLVTQSASSRDGGVTWTSPSATPQGAFTPDLSGASDLSVSPIVAVSGSKVTAVWQVVISFSSAIVQSVNSNDGGVTWSNPLSTPTGNSPNISASGSFGGDPTALAVSGSRAIAMWTYFTGSTLIVQAARAVAPTSVSGAAPYIPLQAFPTPTKFTAQQCADFAVANSATLDLDWDSLSGRAGEGWGPSYAQFPNDNTGGWVCTRQPAYSSTGSIIFL